MRNQCSCNSIDSSCASACIYRRCNRSCSLVLRDAYTVRMHTRVNRKSSIGHGSCVSFWCMILRECMVGLALKNPEPRSIRPPKCFLKVIIFRAFIDTEQGFCGNWKPHIFILNDFLIKEIEIIF